MNPIIDKIRKLLALAESSNEAEAALASSRAHELLLRHNLTMAQLEPQLPEPIAEGTTAQRRHAIHEHAIALAMCDLFDVAVFRKSVYGGRAITFVGLPNNVQAAILTNNYLLAAIDEWYKTRKYMLFGTAQARDYKYGAAARIYQDIKDRKAATLARLEQDAQALVLRSADIAKQALKQFAGKVTKGRNARGARNQGAYALGYRDGQNINPHAARNSNALGSGE